MRHQSTYVEASSFGPVFTRDVFFFSSLATAAGGSGLVFRSTLKNMSVITLLLDKYVFKILITV